MVSDALPLNKEAARLWGGGARPSWLPHGPVCVLPQGRSHGKRLPYSAASPEPPSWNTSSDVLRPEKSSHAAGCLKNICIEKKQLILGQNNIKKKSTDPIDPLIDSFMLLGPLLLRDFILHIPFLVFYQETSGVYLFN